VGDHIFARHGDPLIAGLARDRRDRPARKKARARAGYPYNPFDGACNILVTQTVKIQTHESMNLLTL
jgi:hypothetical protein